VPASLASFINYRYGSTVSAPATRAVLFSADGYSYMADSTGQPLDKIEEDTDRDFFMTPEEAMEYGIIDEAIPIVNTAKSLKTDPCTTIWDGSQKLGGPLCHTK